MLLPQVSIADTTHKVIDLSKSKWEYRWGDLSQNNTTVPWQKIEFPSNPPQRLNKTNVWFRVLLPKHLLDDPHLYIFSIDFLAEVYLENKKIYSFGNFNLQGKGHYEGWPWHMIQLPKHSNGKYLYFRVYSNASDIGLWGEVLIASKGYFLHKMLDQDLLSLSVGPVALLIGLIFILWFLAQPKKLEFILLGLLFLTQGIDIILSTKVIQLYFNHPLLKQYTLAFCFFFFPIGMAAFLERFIGWGYLNSIRRIWQMHILYLIGALGGALLGVYNLPSTYSYFDLLYYFFTLPVLSLVALYIIFKGNNEQKIIASGFLIVSLYWIYSGLIAWNIIPWQEYPHYIPIFLCLILFTYVIIKRSLYTQALETANNKLKLLNQELKSAKKELTKLAILDPLTSVYNRNYLNQKLQEELKLNHRFHQSFGVILLDIDNFKSVNDTFGHNIGDIILIHFTKVLTKSLRETDTLGRWGGEEFLIIAPNIDKNGLLRLAEKLRKKIETYPFPHIDSKTASFGISIYKEGESLDKLIDRADKALYKSKEQGKNKVLLG